MKKLSRLLVIVFALLLIVSLFAGCKGDAEEPSEPSSPADSQKPSSPPTEEGGEEEDVLPYPMISEELIELTIWQTFTADYIASMNDSEFTKELARRTNVLLKFQEASSADATTAYNLMLNSGDYTDIVRPGSDAAAYTGGPDKAIEDGVFLRLNELIEKYAPNYSARRSKPHIAKQTVTDAGNMWSIYSLTDPAEYPWMGFALRGDILENRGIKLPVTLADWEVALQAFLDEGVKYPLLFDITGVSYNSEFLSAFQIGKEFYQKDGKVHYGYIEPEFKDYLTLMNQWYDKGYIDREFVSHGVTFAIFSSNAPDAYQFILKGEAGAALLPWGYTDNALAVDQSTTIEGFKLSPVSAPVMNEGDTIHFRFTAYEAKSPNAITSTCENPEIAIRLLDYLYTDEGSILVNYGIEDVSYTMVDGKPRYTDLILKNPDGFTGRSVAMKYAWDDGIGMVDFTRHWQSYEGLPNEGALEAYNVWNKDSNDYVLPQITRTSEEGERYSAGYSDIQTFANETIPQFIMGTKPLSEFDAFVDQIKSMGIDEIIEIQQNALDRYNARG
jgi:putative aldouronate transport system substrate-binding protein